MVHAAPAPKHSLIAPFARLPGHYTDAFATDVSGDIDLSDFIRAFYTTPLFRAERGVLTLAGTGGSDSEVERLADGTGERFAAWTVEARRDDEILLADISGRTKSWLAVAEKGAGTRLRFGSVIVPTDRGGGPSLGPFVTALIGPHRVYSRALLAAAARRITAAT
jgi:hypothetical protein